MSRISGISKRGIYTDLMRKFRDEGHQVFIVTPHERYMGKPTELKMVDAVHILGVKTLNLRKTNIVEKGLGQVMVEGQYKRAIKHYLQGIEYELIVYSTPPITLMGVVKYLKKKNPNAVSYLLLKDIFPQNAVDIGMFGKNSLFYKYFRKKEENLYRISDYIGCMSPANVEFVLKHNSKITNPDRVEVAPNSVVLPNADIKDSHKREVVRKKYGLPIDKPIFIYGGNLGKPQGIPFLIQCLEANNNRDDCHILVIGTGTELPKLKTWYNTKHPQSVTVMDGLPQAEYDELVKSCDVGLIFLDYRFTIPNFPSRVLNYLENKMPVLCATDPNCDMGSIAEANGFGYWCESNSVEAFTTILDRMIKSDIKIMGEKAFKYLCENYLIENTYNAIIKHL
jgi:hypothetical protein